MHVLGVFFLDLDLVDKLVTEHSLHLLSLLQGELIGASLLEQGLDRLVETLHPLPLRQGVLNHLILLL